MRLAKTGSRCGDGASGASSVSSVSSRWRSIFILRISVEAMNPHDTLSRRWRPLKAPSLAEFEVMAIEAFRRLPETFRALCADLIIRIEDFPTDEVLDKMNARTAFDLLGLFQGVGLPFRSESAP